MPQDERGRVVALIIGSTTPKGKDIAMAVDLFQHLQPRRTQRRELVTCSICLSVRRGSDWREAEQVIRELRTFELDAAPRLRSAVCDACAESIFSRRVPEESEVAAA